MRHWLTIVVGVGSFVWLGCGRAAKPPVTPPSRSPNSGADKEKAALDLAKEPPAAGTPIPGPAGQIEGTVTFVASEIPKSTVVPNGTDPQICGTEMSKQDVIIAPDSRGIRNVMLWLDDVKLPDGYQPPSEPLVLDNTKCHFEPHAATITLGSPIEARNSDEVFHTTNLYGVASENIPLVNKGASYKTKARRVGMIMVKCDKHGWMQAFIRVDPHPFHAVTDTDGKFFIANVPVGTYKLKAWHEMFFGQDVDVAVKVDETTRLELMYPTEQK